MPVQGYLGLVALPIVGTAFAAWLANCAWFHGPVSGIPSQASAEVDGRCADCSKLSSVWGDAL